MSAGATVDARREIARLMQARDWPTALAHIHKALVAQPRAAGLHIHRAQCLVALGQIEEARQAAAVAEQLEPTDALLADAAGGVYSFAGDQRRALQSYERAVGLAPNNPHLLFNRATVRRFLGQLEQAEADYDRVIALRPTDFEAYKNRSDLRKQTAEKNHIAELEAAIAHGFPDWRSEVQIRYALAKELEDVGRYTASFEQLRLAAAKRREHLRYDVENDVATVDWIIEAFPRSTGRPRACGLRACSPSACGGTDIRSGPAPQRHDASGSHPRESCGGGVGR